MANHKQLVLLVLLIGLTFGQFSSFVPSYLLSVPSDFISPVATTQPLDAYIGFKKAPSFQAVFAGSASPAAAERISSSPCQFPFVLLQGECQCPRFLKFVFGKCVGATPEDYGNPAPPPPPTPTPTPTTLVQCPLLKINHKKKTQYIEDLAYISRTYDGTKNNQKFPNWGSSGSFLERRVKANYKDGISKPITNLPGPRIISNAVGSQKNPIKKSSLQVTIAFTIFGQFVDHDLDLTFSQRGNTAQRMDIEIPALDQFFTDQTTIPFARSQFVDEPGRPRRQKNMITSWIDGSQIYGSDNQTVCALRTFKNGKLKVSKGKQGEELLPLFNNFFRAGDVRAIQNSILAVYHTIFLRQHNRLCDDILRSNPKFNDETVFQIARNYVIGLLQKIVLKDFVRILLGNKYDQIIGSYKGYKNNINPNIPTQFSTASYRLGHSLLVNKIPSIRKNGVVEKQFSLNQLFFGQSLVNDDFIANIMRGASKTLTKERSSQIVDDVRNLLILDPTNKSVKLDLYSLNLQRGRDHGLATYNDVRSAFGLSRIQNFAQFLPSSEAAIANKLKSVYVVPDNIELFVGIISEKPVSGAILGELGVQVVGQTFRNLRDADRFWYEGAYPQAVVDEIDATSMGEIIRRNTKAKEIPDDIFIYSW